MAGFNGEALRGLDLRLSRRAGQIRSFALNAKLGQDATLIGDLRSYSSGRNVVYFESNDAGALFRFTDTYPRIAGGQMWVAMDPPSADQEPRDGVVNVRDFAVRGSITRGPARRARGRNLRGRRPAARTHPAGQPDLRGRARLPAQAVRVPRRAGGNRRSLGVPDAVIGPQTTDDRGRTAVL